MGLFSSSKTSVTNTTQNYADSFNTNLSRTDVVADSGNTTFTLTVPPEDGQSDKLLRYMPWIAVACLGLALLLILTQPRKPWEG